MLKDIDNIAARLTGYTGGFVLFQWLSIPSDQINILGMLMIIDFILGIGKQYRINPRDITSHKAWLGIIKKAATILTIISVGLALKGIGANTEVYINGMLSLIIISELYSILQNVYTVRTGIIVKEYDVISLLIKGFGEFIKTRINSSLEKINEKISTDENK